MSTNITWHSSALGREEREKLLSSKGVVIWLTGLSGSGKSTIGRALEANLIREGRFAYGLDGDNIRFGLCKDLGFSPEDRKENIRRIGAVAQLFCDAGAITICSFVSPYKNDRDAVRTLVANRFVEVHVDCSVEECARRDPKGLYKKARAGEIPNFTGISAPYEAPIDPEIHIDTATSSIEHSVNTIVAYLMHQDLLHVVDRPNR
ncbi:MAG: adenylyl-sulfate kinase [Deltaproteobacteria bacterium]|nr:adenylyl-sulfate kinase [Deltaproteobacteria bacterium]